MKQAAIRNQNFAEIVNWFDRNPAAVQFLEGATDENAARIEAFLKDLAYFDVDASHDPELIPELYRIWSEIPSDLAFVVAAKQAGNALVMRALRQAIDAAFRDHSSWLTGKGGYSPERIADFERRFTEGTPVVTVLGYLIQQANLHFYDEIGSLTTVAVDRI